MPNEKPKILITAFSSDYDGSVNISELVAKQIKLDPEKYDFKVVIFPTEYQETLKLFNTITSEYRPDFIISLGENNVLTDSRSIEIETNANDCAFDPDDKGNVPILGSASLKGVDINGDLEKKILQLGSDALKITIDKEGDPSDYLCEYIYLLSLEYMKNNGKEGSAVFMHLDDCLKGATYNAYSKFIENKDLLKSYRDGVLYINGVDIENTAFLSFPTSSQLAYSINYFIGAPSEKVTNKVNTMLSPVELKILNNLLENRSVTLQNNIPENIDTLPFIQTRQIDELYEPVVNAYSEDIEKIINLLAEAIKFNPTTSVKNHPPSMQTEKNGKNR